MAGYNNMNPLVSIITPAFNAEEYISETINSVLQQTFTEWELIIVDDGSTDKTQEVVASFLKDSRIKYIYQKNGRQGKARNTGIKNSSSKYIAFLDADDLWVKDKLEIQLNTIQKKSVDVVFSQGWSFVCGSGENQFTERNTPEGMLESKSFLKVLLYQNVIPALSVLVTRSCIEAVGFFDERLEIQNAEDYQLWLKLADNGFDFYGIKSRLFYYRIHANQSTSFDTYAVKSSVFAINTYKFKRLSRVEKTKLLELNIDRGLLRLIDQDVEINSIADLVSLYHYPASSNMKWLICKCALFINTTLLRKVLYRYTDFNKVKSEIKKLVSGI